MWAKWQLRVDVFRFIVFYYVFPCFYCAFTEFLLRFLLCQLLPTTAWESIDLWPCFRHFTNERLAVTKNLSGSSYEGVFFLARSVLSGSPYLVR